MHEHVTIDEAQLASHSVSVDVARAILRNASRYAAAMAIQFHRQVAEDMCRSKFDFNPPPLPPHDAMCVPTGTGKSEINRSECVASYVRDAKATTRIPRRVLVLVSTHRLAHEARQRIAPDISTGHWQSRRANDVTSGEPMCRNLAAVDAAEAVGADVERTCCKKKRRGQRPIFCRFYQKCLYQKQKAAVKAADVIYAAHEILFAPPAILIKNVGLVVVDEGFWQDALTRAKLAVDGLNAELKAFPVRRYDSSVDQDETAHLADLIRSLQTAIKAQPAGEYMSKVALVAAGLLPSDSNEQGSGRAAAKLAWNRKVNVDLAPDSSEQTVKARVEQYGFLGQLPRRAAMWRHIDDLLSGRDDASGRLRSKIEATKDGSVLYLNLHGRRDIHDKIKGLPIIIMDATLDIEIVKYFLPRIRLALDLKVEAPHQQITQVVGLPVGKSSLRQLEPGKRSAKEEARVARKRERLLKTVIKLADGRSCLVICNKEIQALFENAGPNIEVAHFGAIEGIDRWKDVEVLIVVGRPLPSPGDVEDMAAALTGKPVTLPTYPPARPGGRPQQMLESTRFIRLRNGAEWPLRCRVFGVPEGELIRWAVTEAAIAQAVGRGRGVNRTADNPVEVFIILDDTVVPMPVDVVVHFSDVEPNKIEEMIERGLVPQWSMDAWKLYPDLWPTFEAAKKAYQREMVDVERNRRKSRGAGHCLIKNIYKTMSRTSMVRYRPDGKGQRSRLALIHTKMMGLAGTRARLEAALGPLALFEIVR